MDDPDRKALKLQEILRRFNDRVDELRNAEDPGGNGLTAEFRVRIRGSSQGLASWQLLRVSDYESHIKFINKKRDTLFFSVIE